MRNSRKIKLGKLSFYIVNDAYIDYLSKFDKHIAYNKKEKRPYIGVVITMKKCHYFAPLFSPKKNHKTYRNNLSFFRIIDKNMKKELGIIRFSNMIPIMESMVNPLDLENKSYGYRRLISEQYSYINRTKNKEEILKKATKLYEIITTGKKSKMVKFYKDLSCNFELLEEKCFEYEKLLI